MKQNTELPRSAGLLLHPTSLNTPFGIGDFGSQAFEFVKFLKDAGMKFWQILPIGPTGYGDSPYQCLSSFAGNPLLIAPDGLINLGLLTNKDVLEIMNEDASPNFGEKDIYRWSRDTKIQYDKVAKRKNKILQVAFDRFMDKKNSEFKDLNKEYSEFCVKEAYWLDDFVLYFALKQNYDLKAWIEWPSEHANRVKNPLKVWAVSHQKHLDFIKFVQWIFFKQWDQLKKYANRNGILIIGDCPIFVAHDSADVWAHREFFTVDENGKLIYQAGVPPDYFSETGQLWGNPLYRWDELEKTHFDWLIKRFEHQFRFFDYIRLDHFRGFEAYWRVDAKEKTAINGQWIKAPGEKFFKALLEKHGNLPIIAEDLGIITPEVDALRHMFKFPGMRVLQFAFASDGKNPHLPHNFEKNSVVYSGTHDNNTTLGWWMENASKKEKEYALKYLNSDGTMIIADIIRVLYQSVANLVIIPMQDLLGEGTIARMNVPSTTSGNWQYIAPIDAMKKEKAEFLKGLCEIYDRIN